jgi:hypothetical protein
MAQSEPPGRVARLAFVNGAVSFHDDAQSGWTRAVVNTPLTTGDALWTEPNARSEVSLAGTRIRMEGATELDVLALDDSQTRLQLGQGRIDVKSFAAIGSNQPYEIVTPRGTIRLLQQGDYYVEAGSTEDPTRLGVRSGAAQIQGLNGQVLAVRPNEVAEVTGDGSAMQLRTIQTAPPAPPAYWASRDRQVAYEPPQYLSAGMTGYEDLNAYGDWINDGSYGQVWVPRAAPTGWAPYRTGHWSYVQPWGWTWIDDQPWGFAPYHYGRWAHAGNRWVWVPPQRDVRPVYAPALVAFVGGVELAMTLGNQSAAPVGWFPLGPREVYVPPYTADRDYYLRLNRAARVEDRLLEDRWQRAQRREAFVAGQNSVLMNQRFATVVPTSAFVQSQPVMRSALRVQPQALAAAPVAPVAAPPAPTASVVSVAAAPATVTPPATPQAAAAPAQQPADPKAQDAAKASAETALKASNVAVAKTAVADMPTLAKPASAQMTAAPGPKVASVQPKAATDDRSRQIAPALVPRQGAAPPQLRGAVTPAPASTEPARPGEPPKQQQAAPQPQAVPSPAQARPEAPRQATPPLPGPQQGRPVEPTKPQATPQPQPKPAEPSRQQAAPPPQAPQAPQAPKQPQAAPPPPRAAPQQEGHAAPPHPQPMQQAQPQQQAAPPPQRQPAPQQAAPLQHQAAPPPQRQAEPQPQPQLQRQATPPPQPQHQAAPQPQQHQASQPQQAQTPKPQGNERKDDKK